jgi:hypothetical protein
MRNGNVVLTVVLATVLASMLVGSPASATPPISALPGASGPWPLALTPTIVAAAEPTWVNVHWLTWTPVCRVRVTASATGADLRYPSNTGTYSSFYRGSSLDAGRTDYTAVRVTPTGANATTVLRLRISYVPHRPAAGAGCTGRSVARTFATTLIVLPAVSGSTSAPNRRTNI